LSTADISDPDIFREHQKTDIGLYIGLREGGELDLRVAAQAALTFDTFMRRLVEAIEPGAEIELSLIQGEVGSLNLISSLKAKVSKQTLSALALMAAGWLGGELASYTVQQVFDHLKTNLPEAQAQQIGDDDLRRIAEACVKAQSSPQIAESHRNLTSKLAEDEDVTGVGITLPGEKAPKRVMPRQEFSKVDERAQSLLRPDETPNVRTVETKRELILTEPVLIDRPRKWRFLLGKQEISATVTDEVFRQKALQGKLGVALSQGITVVAHMVITEESLEPGLWKPVKYEITDVSGWWANPEQAPLFSRSEEEDEG
jgi:hypothetical protein